MKQLKMCYLRHEPTEFPLPERYTVKNYETEEEKAKYLPCYRNDMSDRSEEEVEWFNEHIENYRDCKPTKDTFFIMHDGDYVAAITAIMHKHEEGYVHMVGVRQDYRGKKLSNCLNYIALKKLYDQGAKKVILTTTDERLAAIHSYLRAGFLPMVNGFGIKNRADAVARWTKILTSFGYAKYEMLTHFGKKFELQLGE